MKDKRKRIWIDPFQTGLLFRIVFYCVLFQVATWCFFAFCDVINQGLAQLGIEWELSANPLTRTVLVLVALAPPLTVDAVRFAHRLVGPLYRFRKTVQAMAAGEPVALVQLRKGDYLMDLKDDFNLMLQHLESKGYVLVKTAGAPNAAPAPQAANGVAAATLSPNA
jgi:hypothetical protein